MISKQKLKDWGIISVNLKRDVLIYLLFILITSLSTYGVVRFSGFQDKLLGLWYGLYQPLWLVFPVSILQEIIFRGWLMPVLKSKFKNALKVIFLNALLFSLVHVIFPYREFLVPGAFLLGLSYAGIYYFYPNLILVSVSHVLLNLLVIPYCYLGCQFVKY